MKQTIIILGGNSKKNIDWLENISSIFQKKYNVITFKYSNWNLSEFKDVDIEEEVLKFKNIKCSNCIIIAKSVGIIISLLAIKRNYINPKAMIGMGLPLLFLKDYDYQIDELFINAMDKTKLLVIQQRNDYQGSFEQVKEVLPSNIPLVAIEGNDHGYNELTEITKYIAEFIED